MSMCWLSAGRPSHFPFSEEMNVQVRNGLPAVFAGVDCEAEARVGNPEVFGEFGHHVNKNVRGKFFIFLLEVRDALNVFFRNNQNVDRSLGRQVFERDNAVVLVDFLRGDFARRNFAENTIGHFINLREKLFIDADDVLDAVILRDKHV